MVGMMLRMALLALVLAAGGSSVLAQQGTGRSAPRDSATAAAAARRALDTQISALTIELARNRAVLAQLQARLAPGSADAPRTPAERRQLEEKISALAAEMARLDWQLSVQCGEEAPARGYIGVHVLTGFPDESTGGRVRGYPVVQMVEPGSPAARAGLWARDTIIAINRADARESAIEKVVREPGEKVTIVVAREGGRREVMLTVAPKPVTFGGSCMQFRTFSVAPDPAGRANAYIMLPTTVGGAPVFTARGGSIAIVAGAEVSLVNGALKTIFSVEHGALVVGVAQRSPAEEAGVVSGDVIVSAQGEAVTSISVLQRAIQAAAERRSVSLEIVRAKQPKTITLRW